MEKNKKVAYQSVETINYKRVAVLALATLVGAVVIIGVFILLYKASASTTTSSADPATTARVVANLAAIPPTDLNQIGIGSAQNIIKPISGGQSLTGSNGKPEILYVGAEYCPYCAVERWAVVIALDRFGSFSGLGLTTSSASDVYPSTNTLTFSNSSYTSKFVDFTPVEQFGNKPQPTGGYNQLQFLSTKQQQLLAVYDEAPYTSSPGSIPFVDLANQYVFSGATVSPGVISGMNWDDVVTNLKNPTSDVAKGILGSANLITAAVCQITKQQPTLVCNTPLIKQVEQSLPAGK